MPPVSEKYFFDYPIVDANALTYSALKLLFHGSTHGAFGAYGSLNARRGPIDLVKIEALKVSLTYLTSTPLSDEYAYHLVFFNKDFSHTLWDGKSLDKSKHIKDITRRVRLGAEPSLSAKRYRDPFWVKFQKPIYLAQFPSPLHNELSVPAHYRALFENKFDGFLMRSEHDYPLVRNLIEASGLKLGARREVSDELDGDLQVHCYAF
ncbi:hypothetical protein [Rubritalea tangerina]|uniref:Uncharacterized protein n=1 Tax=Rubritalea tangerina TaxID=430798 RepID=A0ABW4Z8P7_9BACT